MACFYCTISPPSRLGSIFCCVIWPIKYFWTGYSLRKFPNMPFDGQFSHMKNKNFHKRIWIHVNPSRYVEYVLVRDVIVHFFLHILAICLPQRRIALHYSFTNHNGRSEWRFRINRIWEKENCISATDWSGGISINSLIFAEFDAISPSHLNYIFFERFDLSPDLFQEIGKGRTPRQEQISFLPQHYHVVPSIRRQRQLRSTSPLIDCPPRGNVRWNQFSELAGQEQRLRLDRNCW